MAAKGGNAFPPQTLAFLRELADNNRRDWFKPNKVRYEEHVLDPALRFIIAMQAPLADFAPHFTAVPDRVGGSLMRIYRDTRFSKDKLPYKTNVGIQFRHESARDVHAPGYYVHVAPSEPECGGRTRIRCVRSGSASWHGRPSGAASSATPRSGVIFTWAETASRERRAVSTRITNASATSCGRASSPFVSLTSRRA